MKRWVINQQGKQNRHPFWHTNGHITDMCCHRKTDTCEILIGVCACICTYMYTCILTSVLTYALMFSHLHILWHWDWHIDIFSDIFSHEGWHTFCYLLWQKEWQKLKNELTYALICPDICCDSWTCTQPRLNVDSKRNMFWRAFWQGLIFCSPSRSRSAAGHCPDLLAVHALAGQGGSGTRNPRTWIQNTWNL